MYLLETANIMFLSFIRFELLSFEYGSPHIAQNVKYMYNSVALLLGYNQVFFHPEVLDFLPIYFPDMLSISGKPRLFSLERRRLDSSNLCMYISRTEKQDESKLVFMPFEIVSICVWLRYFFSETCRTAA